MKTENQQKWKLVLWEDSRIDKPLARHQEWKRVHHYSYLKANHRILGTVYTIKFGNLDEMDKFLKRHKAHLRRSK